MSALCQHRAYIRSKTKALALRTQERHAWFEMKEPPTEAAQNKKPWPGTRARASISGTIPLHAKLIPVTTDSTNGRG